MKWLQWFSALQSSTVTSVWNGARKMHENLILYSLDVSVTGKMTLTHFIAREGYFDFYSFSHLKMNPRSIGIQKMRHRNSNAIHTQSDMAELNSEWVCLRRCRTSIETYQMMAHIECLCLRGCIRRTHRRTDQKGPIHRILLSPCLCAFVCTQMWFFVCTGWFFLLVRP